MNVTVKPVTGSEKRSTLIFATGVLHSSHTGFRYTVHPLSVCGRQVQAQRHRLLAPPSLRAASEGAAAVSAAHPAAVQGGEVGQTADCRMLLAFR